MTIPALDQPRGPDGRWVPTGAAESSPALPEHPVAHGLVDIPDEVDAALDSLREAGLRPVLVGGSVRDALLDPGLDSKDLDFEVYGPPGTSTADLVVALRRHGRVDEVGASFGVVKLNAGGHDVDVSLPRRDSLTGTGHRGFTVAADASMSFAEAAARRDFTVNAVMWDPATGELIDPHGGLEDLRTGTLRHVSDAFDEDPLRVLRGVQLAARFDLGMDPGTAARCRTLAPAYHELPAERVWGEMDKLFTRGTRPSAGLAVLHETGWEQYLPELAACRDVPQDPTWHPEGPVHTHLAMSADEAAARADAAGLSRDRRGVVVAAAMLHDLGKATHTQHHDDGRITSHGHAEAGVAPTRNLLTRLGAPKKFTEQVGVLVGEHMNHQGVGKDGRPSTGSVRRLQRRLAAGGTNLTEWSIVVASDGAARGSAAKPDASTPWLEVAAADSTDGDVSSAPARILTGKHLIDAGHRPGPDFRPVLEAAERAQDDGEFTDEAGALAWLERQRVTG